MGFLSVDYEFTRNSVAFGLFGRHPGDTVGKPISYWQWAPQLHATADLARVIAAFYFFALFSILRQDR
jgi:hypothetical protein